MEPLPLAACMLKEQRLSCMRLKKWPYCGSSPNMRESALFDYASRYLVLPGAQHDSNLMHHQNGDSQYCYQ